MERLRKLRVREARSDLILNPRPVNALLVIVIVVVTQVYYISRVQLLLPRSCNESFPTTVFARKKGAKRERIARAFSQG